jgi:hypothetical protein
MHVQSSSVAFVLLFEWLRGPSAKTAMPVAAMLELHLCVNGRHPSLAILDKPRPAEPVSENVNERAGSLAFPAGVLALELGGPRFGGQILRRARRMGSRPDTFDSIWAPQGGPALRSVSALASTLGGSSALRRAPRRRAIPTAKASGDGLGSVSVAVRADRRGRPWCGIKNLGHNAHGVLR